MKRIPQLLFIVIVGLPPIGSLICMDKQETQKKICPGAKEIFKHRNSTTKKPELQKLGETFFGNQEAPSPERNRKILRRHSNPAKPKAISQKPIEQN